MLLTVDVGNTNICCGIFDGDELVTTFRFITKQTRTPDEFSLQIHAILEVKGIKEEQVTDVIISSVVPNLNNDLIIALKQCFHTEPMMIAAGIKTGLSLNIDDPKSCGADLIVDCVAAYNKYKRDCLVVDFGTATKFLYVTNKGVFTGAVIAPGLEIYASTLWGSTAQLPAVQLKKPDKVLGTNTVTCMQSGIVNGYIGLTKGIIEDIQNEIGHDFPILATGGLGRILYQSVSQIDEYDPDLAYTGMKLIYERNKKGDQK